MTSRVLCPEEAVERLEQAIVATPQLRVVGVAGPGEPLYNAQTYETLRLVRNCHPELSLCVSSNGFLVEERLPELISCGVGTLTITINAVDVQAASQIYEDVFVDRQQFPKREDRIRQLLARQQFGLYRACEAGIHVKINTVLIPGVNEDQIERIARMGKDAGAAVMNIMPLIPCGKMARQNAPDKETMLRARARAGKYIPQFLLCKQCRADACGIPGRSEKKAKKISPTDGK